MKPKLEPRVRLYDLVWDRVTDAVMFGGNRSFKHTTRPDREVIMHNVYREVMNALSDGFDLDS